MHHQSPSLYPISSLPSNAVSVLSAFDARDSISPGTKKIRNSCEFMHPFPPPHTACFLTKFPPTRPRAGLHQRCPLQTGWKIGRKVAAGTGRGGEGKPEEGNLCCFLKPPPPQVGRREEGGHKGWGREEKAAFSSRV